MREYKFQATESTVAALRLLRGAWRGMTVDATTVTVFLDDERVVRIQSEAADVEGIFDAYRVEALLEEDPAPLGETMAAFAAGQNDIVLFTGASWSEQGASPMSVGAEGPFGADSSVGFSGHPGQISPSAEVVCLTTDAVVVASSSGTGLLVRTGLKPNTLDVVRDPETIAAFLVARGYQ